MSCSQCETGLEGTERRQRQQVPRKETHIRGEIMREMLTGHSGWDSISLKAALHSAGRPPEGAVWKYTHLHSKNRGNQLLSM